MLGLVVGLMVGAAQAPEHAEPTGPAAPLKITAPIWRDRATGQDVGRVYPRQALKERLDAAVIVECQVAADGRMAACAVVREEPGGYGFGEAALKLTPKFRMRATLADGTPVAGGVVRLPLRFVGPWNF
jgi:protein TonB